MFDVMQVPYLEPTNIRRHRRKLSRSGDLAAGIGAAPRIDHLFIYEYNMKVNNRQHAAS